MTDSLRWLISEARPFAAAMVCAACCSASPTLAQYAQQVVSYDAGTTPAIEFGSNLPFDVSAAALGEPSRLTSDPQFPSVVSPFSPPYRRDQLVSIGEGGHLTLRLSHFALPQEGAAEIGVFAHAGLSLDFGTGRALAPVQPFGVDEAHVEVSADGSQWVSLGLIAFDIPTNGFTDLSDPFSPTAGSVPSDFQQPFTGSLASFTGLKYSDPGEVDVLEVLGGSGGGMWLDISPTGLAQVGYIRFSVADDFSSTTSLNFELDAVAISHAALGGATVPEPGAPLLVTLAAAGLAAWRRRRSW